MGCAEDVIHEVCRLKKIDPGQKWILSNFWVVLSVSTRITYDRRYREHILATVDVEIKALIVETSEMLLYMLMYQWFVARGVPVPSQSNQTAERSKKSMVFLLQKNKRPHNGNHSWAEITKLHILSYTTKLRRKFKMGHWCNTGSNRCRRYRSIDVASFFLSGLVISDPWVTCWVRVGEQ